MRKSLLLCFLLMNGLVQVASSQVSDPLFNGILKTLLSQSVKEVSVKDAVIRYDALFLDARTKEEYDVSHIKGARYIGFEDFDLSILNGVKKDQPIIVYCAVGYRSEKVGEKLLEAGYTNVWNMYGGIFEWINSGYTVYDNSGKPTNKIHGYDKSWSMWLKKGEKVY